MRATPVRDQVPRDRPRTNSDRPSRDRPRTNSDRPPWDRARTNGDRPPRDRPRTNGDRPPLDRARATADRYGATRDRTSPAPRPEVTRTVGRAPMQAGVPGRRTVTIQGRGSDRSWTPTGQRKRPVRRPHERDGFRPDRAAMWAVMLGVFLVLVAATSSHAAIRAHVARTAARHAATVAHVSGRSAVAVSAPRR